MLQALKYHIYKNFIFKICSAEYQEHFSLAKTTASQNITTLCYNLATDQEGIIYNWLGFQRKKEVSVSTDLFTW